MRFFSIFKRKPESAAEKQALENLDEVTREVAWDEYDKPGGHLPGAPFDPPHDDSDPAGPGGLRDALREDEKPS